MNFVELFGIGHVYTTIPVKVFEEDNTNRDGAMVENNPDGHGQ